MVQKEIFIQPNPDKEFLVDDKCPLMPPSGARIIMAGRCGVGKGNACKNLIARFNPPLERICVFPTLKDMAWLGAAPASRKRGRDEDSEGA